MNKPPKSFSSSQKIKCQNSQINNNWRVRNKYRNREFEKDGIVLVIGAFPQNNLFKAPKKSYQGYYFF